MKKIILTGLSLTLLLVSCGGGSNKNVTPNPTPNPTPHPSPTPTTLYQGVWGWAIGNPDTKTIIDQGAVIYNQQVNNSGRTVAGGVYINESESKKGISLLGPISATGKLETAFTANTTADDQFYFVGIDEDGAMGNYKGMPEFTGPGAVLDANGNTTQEVLVVLLQSSTTVPGGKAELNSVKAQAKAQALQALQSQISLNTLKFNAQSLKAITKSIRN